MAASEQHPTSTPAGRRSRTTTLLVIAGLIVVGVVGVAGVSVLRGRRSLPSPPPPPSTTTLAPTTADLTIRAQGTTGTEEIEVWVGVHLVSRFTASTAGTTERVTTGFDGDVEVRFVNDATVEAGNRDVTVDYITIDGQRFDSESPTTITTGFWDPTQEACRSEPSTPEVDTLYCNGAFRYARVDDGVVSLPEYVPPTEDGVDELPADAFFVAVDGDDEGPGSRDRPWRTIQHAADQAPAGATVVVRGGTYVEDIVIRRSGRADAPTTYRNHPGERPVIRAMEGPGMHVESPQAPVTRFTPEERLDLEPVAYITVRGFELAGENNTSSDGWASGFSIEYAHDIRLVDNIIHGFPGGGVSTHSSDNVLVSGHQIDSVGSRGLMQFSGLSVFQSVNWGGPDIEPGFRMVLRDNVVTNVRAELTTTGKQFGADYRSVVEPDDTADDVEADGIYSDANCVIIDDTRHTQFDSAFPDYTGWTLVEGNRCTGNMGRGVHVFLSDRVLARNNVLTGNLAANRWYPPPPVFGHDPWRDFRWTGELNASQSTQVRFEDNIVDAVGAFDRNSWESSDVEFVGNDYVGGPIETSFTDGASFTDEAVVAAGSGSAVDPPPDE